jgi:hypothetical protein
MVLSKSRDRCPVLVEDIISPSARAEMVSLGIPPAEHLGAAPCIPAIFEVFPPILVAGIGETNLKYVPVALHASDGTFEAMRSMNFSGLTPWELYQSKLAPRLRELGL